MFSLQCMPNFDDIMYCARYPCYEIEFYLMLAINDLFCTVQWFGLLLSTAVHDCMRVFEKEYIMVCLKNCTV